jgi:hypothetical protein
MIEHILSILFIIGFLSFYPKIYFHFQYLKIVEKFDVGIIEFFRSSIKFFWHDIVVMLPFFWSYNEGRLSKLELLQVKKIKRLIYIFLSFIWLGLLSLIIGIINK